MLPVIAVQTLAERVSMNEEHCYACRKRIVIVEDGPEAFIDAGPHGSIVAYHLACAKKAGRFR